MSKSAETILKPFNPLDGFSFDVGVGAGIAMRPAHHCARFSLRIATEQIKKAATAFDMDIPENVGGMSLSDKKFALCLGPDEWLLMAPQSISEEIITRFANLAESNFHSLVDITHQTIGLEIFGPLASIVLNGGCPLDLEAMESGRCTRTVLDKAQIILIKLEEQKYRLEIIRSFAPYVWSFLEKAGREAKQCTPVI